MRKALWSTASKAIALIALIATNAALVACKGSASDGPATNDSTDDEDAGRTFGGARPVTVRVPAGYDAAKPAPLVVMLHGFASAGPLTDLYFKLSSVADANGFFYVTPNGTVDSTGRRFWNATDACCDDEHTGVGDVAYLTSLVDEIAGVYSIDRKRIYAVGHSNGGFMAHRLACDAADKFAAIVSYAGATWADTSKCRPSEPVAVLQIHGTADESVAYGGTLDLPDAGGGGRYPGAEQTVAAWSAKDICAGALVDTGTTLHVNVDATGSETKVLRHDACAQNGAAELWRVQGAGHIFAFTPESLQAIWQFLETHAKR